MSEPLSIIDWDKKDAEHYGSIRELLKIKGDVIGAMDMKIAANARSQCFLLQIVKDILQRVLKLIVESCTN